MTKEDITRMAREAGGCDIASHGWTSWVGTQTTEFLERFAAIVAAAEREACAKVLDEMAIQDKLTNYYGIAAADIRARGEK